MSQVHEPSFNLDRLVGFLLKDPSNFRLRRDALSEAIRQEAWDTAIALAETGLLLQPEDNGLLEMQGLALLHRGRYIEAERTLEATTVGGHYSGIACYNIAFARFMQGRFEDALEQLDAPIVPAEIEAADLLRARCRHHLGQRGIARSACEAFLARVPDSLEGRGFLGLLLVEDGRLQEGNALAESVLRIDPSQIDALVAKASSEQAFGNRKVARAAFEQLVLEHPDCGRGWLGLALELACVQELQSALEAASRATGLLPNHIGTWHVLGWLGVLLEDTATAQRAFERALALDRNFGETHGALAALAALRGDEAQAHRSIRRAVILDPKASSVYYARYVLALRQTDHASAREQLECYLAASSGQPGSRLRHLFLQQVINR